MDSLKKLGVSMFVIVPSGPSDEIGYLNQPGNLGIDV